MNEFDPGPTLDFAEHFAQVPDYAPFKEHFWYDWGPIFYRGRLDGTARVLCIASDPGATERIALRTLVGDAGQRTQGFLAKIGLTRSYLCFNAFAYGLMPSHASKGARILRDPEQLAWRNALYTKSLNPNLQVIIAFGEQAQDAVGLWGGKGTVPVIAIPHPSSRDSKKLANEWRNTVTQLRVLVTPDSDGNPSLPNYGSELQESDYAPIPKRDLPFGLPDWFGDDAWGRRATPVHVNSVNRPKNNSKNGLSWIAPRSGIDV